MLYLLLILSCAPSFLLIFRFAFTWIKKKEPLHPIINVLIELWVLGAMSIIFLTFNMGPPDCCTDWAINSTYGTPIVTLYILGILSYFIIRYAEKPFPPIVELLLRSSLFAYLILDIVLMIHMKGDLYYSFFGFMPVALLLIQAMFLRNLQYVPNTKISRLLLPWPKSSQGLKLLRQVPILSIAFIPVAFILNGFLILFGQRPDAIVLAFTQTYNQYFSELDSLCDNIICGGHYLCSVAANGNKKWVKSNRLGIRHGNLILCNRQLLVSNAFENILEEKAPRIHRFIRRYYDQVGDQIHKDYRVYEKKWVSNVIYACMKPLEWLFIIVIYSTDVHPENRIALQYSGLTKEEIARFKNLSDLQ